MYPWQQSSFICYEISQKGMSRCYIPPQKLSRYNDQIKIVCLLSDFFRKKCQKVRVKRSKNTERGNWTKKTCNN